MLRGHYDHYQPDDEPCERSWNRGNFIAILYAFADMDLILKEHLDHGARNAKMISWKIQNEIIATTEQLIRCRIKEIIAEGGGY